MIAQTENTSRSSEPVPVETAPLAEELLERLNRLGSRQREGWIPKPDIEAIKQRVLSHVEHLYPKVKGFLGLMRVSRLTSIVSKEARPSSIETSVEAF
jgi:hypothetical protein